MPFINTKTTAPLNKDKKALLTKELSQIAKQCLGKGENWVMVGYEEQVDLSFQGSEENIAYIEVKLYGTPQASACDQMTAQVCDLLEKELGIPSNRIYVSYYPTNQWGWNGGNF